MHKKLIEFNLGKRNQKKLEFNPGDVVKVHRRIIEGEKELSQVFEGMIVAIKGKQSSSPMLTVRKISHGVGTELVLPIYSPLVKKIELVKKARARRSKLYHVRDKAAKSLRIKYQEVSSLVEEDKKKEPKLESKENTEK